MMVGDNFLSSPKEDLSGMSCPRFFMLLTRYLVRSYLDMSTKGSICFTCAEENAANTITTNPKMASLFIGFSLISNNYPIGIHDTKDQSNVKKRCG